MVNSRPQISVIMSTYNRKEFLPISIESILAQTHENYEFILINNGSTDGSDKICIDYAKRDSRIRFINIAQNYGAPIGRNTGLDAARGAYVTIVDDDDRCEREMLEFLWNLAAEHNADISLCGSWNDFGDRKEAYYIFDELLVLDKVKGLEELLKREKYNVAPPTKLFRKSLFEGIRFKEGVLVDDIHVIYKIFTEANIIAAQGKPLYNFTKHANNMTSFIHMDTLTPALLTEYLTAFHERTEYLSKHVPEITKRVRYSEWSYIISMCSKIKRNNIIDCMSLYNLLIDKLKKNYSEVICNPYLTDLEIHFIKQHIDL